MNKEEGRGERKAKERRRAPVGITYVAALYRPKCVHFAA